MTFVGEQAATGGTPTADATKRRRSRENSPYTPPQRGVIHRAVEPGRKGEESDNTRTNETESSRTVIQPMSGNAPMARLPSRRKPQTARAGGRKLSEATAIAPPNRKPASHRTTIINRSIIVGRALDIRGFLLPNALRSEEAFILLFVDSGCRYGPPKTLCSFLR
jgi:hypothetical protein